LARLMEVLKSPPIWRSWVKLTAAGKKNYTTGSKKGHRVKKRFFQKGRKTAEEKKKQLVVKTNRGTWGRGTMNLRENPKNLKRKDNWGHEPIGQQGTKTKLLGSGEKERLQKGLGELTTTDSPNKKC